MKLIAFATSLFLLNAAAIFASPISISDEIVLSARAGRRWPAHYYPPEGPAPKREYDNEVFLSARVRQRYPGYYYPSMGSAPKREYDDEFPLSARGRRYQNHYSREYDELD